MKKEFIREVLDDCGCSFTDDHVNQIFGTALVESNLKNVKQKGGGPALGYFQMEPATRKDIIANYINYYPLTLKKITDGVGTLIVTDEGFLNRPALQVIFCWLHYRRFKAWGNSVEMYAVNWKRRYNTMK